MNASTPAPRTKVELPKLTVQEGDGEYLLFIGDTWIEWVLDEQPLTEIAHRCNVHDELVRERDELLTALAKHLDERRVVLIDVQNQIEVQRDVLLDRIQTLENGLKQTLSEFVIYGGYGNFVAERMRTIIRSTLGYDSSDAALSTATDTNTTVRTPDQMDGLVMHLIAAEKISVEMERALSDFIEAHRVALVRAQKAEARETYLKQSRDYQADRTNAALAHIKTLETKAQALVDMYVANQGTRHEFISCITPNHTIGDDPVKRAADLTWRAWDELRAALSTIDAQPQADGGGA